MRSHNKNINKIFKIISTEFNCSIENLRIFKTRKRDIVEPQFMASLLLRHYLDLSDTDIAILFKIDRSTAIFRINKTRELITSDKRFKKIYKNCLEKLDIFFMRNLPATKNGISHKKVMLIIWINGMKNSSNKPIIWQLLPFKLRVLKIKKFLELYNENFN